MTKLELANENAALRASLSQAMNDLRNESDHVRRLRILIANRYSTPTDVAAKIDASMARRAALRARIEESTCSLGD